MESKKQKNSIEWEDKEYIKMWTEENINYYDFENALLNYSQKPREKYGIGISSAIMCGKNFLGEMYIPKKELDLAAEEGYDFFMSKEKFQLLLQDIKSSIKKMNEVIKHLLSIDLEKLSAEELDSAWRNYWVYPEIFFHYNMTQPHYFTKIEGELIRYLKKIKVEDINGTIKILTSSKNKLVLKVPLFEKSFSEILKGEDCKIDKSVFSEKPFDKVKKSQIKRNALIKNLKLPKKITYMTEVLRTIGEVRLGMRYHWSFANYYNELFLKEMKRRYGVSKEELRLYEVPELINLLFKEEKLPNEKRLLRNKRFVKILENDKFKTLEGESAETFISKLKNERKVFSTKGNVANKGYAIGKVVLLSYTNSENHPKKIDSMKRGGIVVSEMTRPNIISACKKAGAIVTDEGGLLSHAAIISRELNVPCVIGTKNSTEVFKDGDYIKVDANKGTATKVSKEEYFEYINPISPKQTT